MLSVRDREIERQMVAFKAPAPRRVSRFPKEGHVIERWIAANGVMLHFTEYIFEGDDRLRLQRSALT